MEVRFQPLSSGSSTSASGRDWRPDAGEAKPAWAIKAGCPQPPVLEAAPVGGELVGPLPGAETLWVAELEVAEIEKRPTALRRGCPLVLKALLLRRHRLRYSWVLLESLSDFGSS